MASEADSAPAVSAATPADDLHRNLMVNFVPQTWSNDDLQKFFSKFGPIESARVIMDKSTQQSKGFAFIKFVNRKDAEACVEQANGQEVEGKHLKVQKAELGKGPPGNAAVYVSGFEPGTSETDIRSIFQAYGTVVRVNMPTPNPGMKGVAFVTFEYFAEAQLAVDSLQTGCKLGDANLTVRLAEATKKAAEAHGMSPNMGSRMGAQRYQPYPMKGGKGAKGWGGWDWTMQGSWGMPPYGGYPQAAWGPSPFGAYPQSGGAAGSWGAGWSDPSQAPAANPLSMVNGTPPMAPNSTDGCYCLFVYGVQNIDENFLWRLFSPFGTVANVKAMEGKNFGFVNMPNYYEALNAVNSLNGNKLPGMPQRMQVSFKQERS